MSEPITQALVLAAGRGGRLGEWGKTHPKCLLLLQNKPLIDYHLRSVGAAWLSADCD